MPFEWMEDTDPALVVLQQRIAALEVEVLRLQTEDKLHAWIDQMFPHLRREEGHWQACEDRAPRCRDERRG